MIGSDGCTSLGGVKAATGAEEFDSATAKDEETVLIKAFDVTTLQISVSVPPLSSLQVRLEYDAVLLRKGGKVSFVLPVTSSLPTDELTASFFVAEKNGLQDLTCVSTTPNVAGVTSSTQIIKELSSGLAEEARATISIPSSLSSAAKGFSDRIECEYVPGQTPAEGQLYFDDEGYILWLFNPAAQYSAMQRSFALVLGKFALFISS